MPDHIVLYGGGDQTLRHIPRDSLGRPTVATSPTYAIVDLRESDENTAERFIVAAGTSATVSSASEALTAAAGPNLSAYADQVSVTNANEFTAGRQYILQATDGRRELVTVKSVGSGVLYLQRDLVGDYPATTSTLRAVELEATFPSAEAANEDDTVEDNGGPYAVVWTYTAGDRQVVTWERVFVRRYVFSAWGTEEDVLRGHPSIADRLEPGRLADAVALASEEIEADLEAAGFIPANYRSTKYGMLAWRYLALSFIFRNFTGPNDEEFAAQYREEYKTRLHNMTTGLAPKGTVVVSEHDDQHLPLHENVTAIFKTR